MFIHTKSVVNEMIDVDQPLKPKTSFARAMTTARQPHTKRLMRVILTLPSFNVAACVSFCPVRELRNSPQLGTSTWSWTLSDELRAEL